ncbi:zinc ribbon domain-containing protein [uncultured Methanobrevibacter sp.]|uniref:zinc ribbon domain-containing protein n=1 Tax=uncultured Methanobrevibacter sp. TaxID=253161 RepID=UPI0025F19950|nr:zinc ribbon domain-containing protein [uncultured Methanobrevibacter sp.]
MFCYNCGEENPDEAKFCRNCGATLKKEETVKKVEVLEARNHQQNTNSQQTTTTSKNNDSNWIGCCLCIIGIFIVFAILGSL